MDESTGQRAWGRHIAWACFIIACLQLTFQQPHTGVIPGERANIFSALFCLVALTAALVFGRRDRLLSRPLALWLPLALSLLTVISGLFSATPASSLARAFVISFSALGGFWCPILLLDNERRYKFFQWFCFGMFWGVLVLATLGVMVKGQIHYYLDPHWHPVGSRILLLSFAPLAIAASGAGGRKALGIVTLFCGYLVLLLAVKYAGMESVVMIPAGLCLLAVCSRPWKKSLIILFTVILFLMSLAMGKMLVDNAANLTKGHQAVSYRVENFSFSWHIAKKHPFFGIGLWAPRDDCLTDYIVHYPHLTRKNFKQWTQDLRTSENLFLTFMADLGFPFLFLYCGSLAWLLWRGFKAVFLPPDNAPYHPLALVLPICGALVHFLVLDGLFQPQISWYFHLILGLILLTGVRAEPAGRWFAAFFLRLMVFGVTLVLGAGLGAWITMA